MKQGLQYHFRIALSAKDSSCSLKLLPQLFEIVNFTVVNQNMPSAIGLNGLFSRYRQVQYGQSSVAQSDQTFTTVSNPLPLTVWPTVRLNRHHPLDSGGNIHLFFKRCDSCNTTHIYRLIELISELKRCSSNSGFEGYSCKTLSIVHSRKTHRCAIALQTRHCIFASLFSMHNLFRIFVHTIDRDTRHC